MCEIRGIKRVPSPRIGRLTTWLSVASLLVVASCGGDDEATTAPQAGATGATSGQTPAEAANEALLEEAEAQQQSSKELETFVLERLNEKFDIATCKPGTYCSYGVPASKERPIRVGDDVEVKKGSICFVDQVFTGPDPGFTNEYLPLYDPDGDGGIVIGLYSGTPDADCLRAFGDALGWN